MSIPFFLNNYTHYFSYFQKNLKYNLFEFSDLDVHLIHLNAQTLALQNSICFYNNSINIIVYLFLEQSVNSSNDNLVSKNPIRHFPSSELCNKKNLTNCLYSLLNLNLMLSKRHCFRQLIFLKQKNYNQ